MKYIPLFLVALLTILSGCADKDKKGDAAAFGDARIPRPLPPGLGSPDYIVIIQFKLE